MVVLASVSLWLGLPHRLLSGLPDAAAIALTLLCYICVSIPSDVLGGYYLPRQHGRTHITLASFFKAWLRGVLAQALVVGICAAALLEVGRWGGSGAAIACFTLLMLTLLAAQPVLARVVGGLHASGLGTVQQSATAGEPPLAGTIFGSFDPGFVGGLVGFPKAERLIVPAAWQQDLAADVLAAELTRRQGAVATGARTRGLIVALAWNVVGFALACRLPGASLQDASGLIQTALWFTLWSFVGLLTLPSINRPAVLEVDRFALDQGVAPDVLAATIRRLDALQDDEPSRTKWVERVFHPIPSVEHRIAALSGEGSHVGAWQCARTTLYLSWACFGFLARAVHCNAGRPELWVLFPGD